LSVFYSLVNAIIVIVLIYVLAMVLRGRGVLSEEHSLALARIVTDLCLPAMIFGYWSQKTGFNKVEKEEALNNKYNKIGILRGSDPMPCWK
jgi:uncharacterized membrane protein